jgi:hypothetical protein
LGGKRTDRTNPYAQEANTSEQLNARTGHQPAASAQAGGSTRQGQSPDTNVQLNARTNGNAQLNARTSNGMSANGQLERRTFTNQERHITQARSQALESELFASGPIMPTGRDKRFAPGRNPVAMLVSL